MTQRIELRALRSDAARKDLAIAGVPGEGNAAGAEVLQGHRCIPEGILRHRAADHPPQFIHPRPRPSQLCRAAQARVEPLRVAIPTLVVNAPAGRARQRRRQLSLSLRLAVGHGGKSKEKEKIPRTKSACLGWFMTILLSRIDRRRVPSKQSTGRECSRDDSVGIDFRRSQDWSARQRRGPSTNSECRRHERWHARRSRTAREAEMLDLLAGGWPPRPGLSDQVIRGWTSQRAPTPSRSEPDENSVVGDRQLAPDPS